MTNNSTSKDEYITYLEDRITEMERLLAKTEVRENRLRTENEELRQKILELLQNKS